MSRTADVSKDIMDALRQGTREQAEDIRAMLKKVGKKTTSKAKRGGTYLDRTGKYRRSWSTDVSETGSGITVTTYAQKPQYRKAHLLEFGHLTRSGTRVKAFPHIAPAEDWAVAEIDKELKKV